MVLRNYCAHLTTNYLSFISHVVPQRDKPRFWCRCECILAPPGGEFLRPQGYLRQQRPRSSDQGDAGEFADLGLSLHWPKSNLTLVINVYNLNIL